MTVALRGSGFKKLGWTTAGGPPAAFGRSAVTGLIAMVLPGTARLPEEVTPRGSSALPW